MEQFPNARSTLEVMESPQGADEAIRTKIKNVRNTVLTLHKALLDSERTSYEIVHGGIGSPAAFLQLLIHDPWFAWLQPMTNLIVYIDETLAAKRPPAEIPGLQRLLEDTRALLSPSRDQENGFWKRYSAVLQRDPAVALLHKQISEELDSR